MTLDPARVKQFWDDRARRGGGAALTNLEEDPELQALKQRLEAARVAEIVGALAPTHDVLDLGGGTGTWALAFAPLVRSVHVVDYCAALVELGRARAAELGLANVAFSHAAAQDFATTATYDLIFISGLVLYLTDAELAQLLAGIARWSRPGTAVVLRDATALAARYEIDRWSEALQAGYAAIYRTRDELIAAFTGIGLALVRDADMFEAGSPLNKWAETRLRIYRFER